MTDVKEMMDIIESLVKSIGVIVGGIWVYSKFIKTREGYSKAEFFVDLRVLGRQDDKIIIEVIGNLQNKSLIRRYITNFTCDILILRSFEPVVHGGKKTNYQLLFNKCNPVKESGDTAKQERIELIPATWDGSSFIDAGLSQRYTYLSSVPADTTFISIYGKFHYLEMKGGKITDFQSAQKTFSVKQLELNNA